jgi:hypothetical protein
VLRQAAGGLIVASHPKLGERFLSCESATALLFTENETNSERLFGTPNRTPYVKDGIDRFIVHGRHDALNPGANGTKASAHYPLTVEAGGSRSIRLRFEQVAPVNPFGSGFDTIMEARRNEAEEFYASVIPASFDPDAANVMRQALAGVLWSKQFYYYDVDRWLKERGADPFRSKRGAAPRNAHWHHMHNADIISMPDKWECPWYAAWDLAFHVLANALIIRALLQYYMYYGNEFTIECPTGSGRHLTLYQVAEEIARRLASIFLRDKEGRRPVYGGARKFQEDPHWHDLILFYEYFHGDNGAGLDASHQTGWTGIIARIMHLFATTTSEPADAMLQRFYDRLLAVLQQPPVRDGRWGLLDCTPAWDGNWTSRPSRLSNLAR